MLTELLYPVSPEALSFRAQVGSLISPLRRIRPHKPFWQLAAHRIPTLWNLYRGLQREAPSPAIRGRIAYEFRKHRSQTGGSQVRYQLQKGYRWLDLFTRANAGDAKLRTILKRYDSMLLEKYRTEAFKRTLLAEVASQMKRRSIMTGASIGPTEVHGPLPRLKPQPPEISAIIRKRSKRRVRTAEDISRISEWKQHLRHESDFESMLETNASIQLPDIFRLKQEWEAPFKANIDHINQIYQRDTARASQAFPPALLKKLAEARRRRIANKTRERERERRGEILPITLRRQRRGPPAHVLRMMTPEQRAMDKISRSPSEVGYVGMVKRKLGFKLKDPEAWKREIGSPDNAAKVDAMTAQIHEENRKRRRTFEAMQQVSDS